MVDSHERNQRDAKEQIHHEGEKGTTTKAKSTQRIQRKKNDAADEFAEEQDSESSTFEDGYDEDLYGDGDDRRRLEALPELEREMILYDRGEEREKNYEAWKAAHDAKRSHKQKNAVVQPRGERSGRHRKERTALDELVQEKKRRNLKANRQERTRTKAVPAKKRIQREEFATSEEEGAPDRSEEDQDSDAERYLEEEDEDEGRDPRFLAGGERGSRGEYDRFMETEINFSDAKKMQVTRIQLDKWMEDPIFDQVLPHCLVRFPDSQRDGVKYYAVGEAARIEVKEPRKEYAMPESKKRTRKYLVLRSGNSEKVIALSMVSNSPFTVQEFDSYLERLESKGAPVPTQAMRDLVISNIKKAENFRYSAGDIARMVEEKKKAKRTPVNIAMEKEKLIAQRNYARQQGKEQEAQSLQERIDELEATQERLRKESRRDGGLASVNKRNAMTNFMKQLRGVGNSGMAGASATGNTVDLFSRRQTRPRTYGKTGRVNVLDHQGKGRDEKYTAPIDNLKEPDSTSLIDIQVDLDKIGNFKPEDETQSIIRQLLGASRDHPVHEITVPSGEYPPESILELEEYSRLRNM
uniref:Plus3 domain-containing protein n=1 Tax=Picocystis salinarum TaxID=88271 RepID=A0A6U9R972_9CHLO